MAYQVHLDRCELYGIGSVEESASRGVIEYDGIGSGAFAIPKNAGLKSWNIALELTQEDLGQQGWCAADIVLNELRGMLKNKNGQRLVIISDSHRLSRLVLLQNLKYKTDYQGVYSVTISLMEYIKGRAGLSESSKVTRPGIPPKAPDIIRAIDAYDTLAARRKFEVPHPSTVYLICDPQTGKQLNPAALRDEYMVKMIINDSNSAFITEKQKEFAAMSREITNAYKQYDNLFGSE